MLVRVATLPLSFLPTAIKAFYFINRPPWANISSPNVIQNILLVDSKGQTISEANYGILNFSKKGQNSLS